MNTPTAARPIERKDSHWYTATGEPCYELTGKTTGKPRAVTIKDARELNLLPSVTTVLRTLDKPALNTWLIEQACLAVLTTPRKEGEELDIFVERVLHVEQIQNQESNIALDKGVELHAAFADYFGGIEIDPTLKEWIAAALAKLETYGKVVATEKILVGDGFAGKTDLILEGPDLWWVWDIKTTKKLPDPRKGGAWIEHRLQLSGYAQAFEDLLVRGGEETLRNPKPIRTANLYVSSIKPNEFVMCEHDADWQTTFNMGFAPLITYWQFANKYRPAGAAPRIITRKEVDAMQAAAVKGTEPEPPTAGPEAAAPVAIAPLPAVPAPKPGFPPNAIALKDGKHVVYSLGQVSQPQ